MKKPIITNRLKNVAYHEAGHVAAFFYFKKPFRDVTIIPNVQENYKGIVRPSQYFSPSRLLERRGYGEQDISHRVEKLLFLGSIISAAGPVSEVRFKKVRRFSSLCIGDMSSIKGSWYFAPNGYTAFKGYKKNVIAKAWNIINDPLYWKIIKATADKLLEKETLTYQECIDIRDAAKNDHLSEQQ